MVLNYFICAASLPHLRETKLPLSVTVRKSSLTNYYVSFLVPFIDAVYDNKYIPAAFSPCTIKHVNAELKMHQTACGTVSAQKRIHS